MKKLLLASALALTTSVAVADPIYLDIGADFGGNDDFAVDTNTTGWLDQLTLIYQSSSTVIDLDDSFGLSDGDSITTNGGFIDGEVGSIATNIITGFNPQENVLGGPSDNGYGGSNWGITFQITDLVGTIEGGANQYLSYTSGAISFFYFQAGMTATTDFIELFTIDVTSSGQTASGSYVQGELGNYGIDDVNGVVAGNVFNTALGGFKEYSESGNLPSVYAYIDYNTEDPVAELIGFDQDQHAIFAIDGQHDGSIAFNVPEPTSLAILGLGLLGFAASSRKKSA